MYYIVQDRETAEVLNGSFDMLNAPKNKAIYFADKAMIEELEAERKKGEHAVALISSLNRDMDRELGANFECEEVDYAKLFKTRKPLKDLLLKDHRAVCSKIRGEAIAKTIDEAANKRVKIKYSDLLRSDITPPPATVEGLICEGVNVICAPPKSGKSFFAMQLAKSIATGTEFLGRKTQKGSVLYCNLEYKLGITRQRGELQGDNAETFDNVVFDVWDSLPFIGEGAEQELVDWIDSTPAPHTIIIDTLIQTIPAKQQNNNAYLDDTRRIMKPWRGIAHGFNVTLILVHHTNKKPFDPAKDDFFASMSGTNGIRGGSDNNIGIYRDIAANQTTIYTESRVFQGRSILAATDNAMNWYVVCANAEEYHRNKEYNRNPIVTLLRRLYSQNKNAKAIYFYEEIDELQDKLMQQGVLKEYAYTNRADFARKLNKGDLTAQILENDNFEVEIGRYRKNGIQAKGVLITPKLLGKEVSGEIPQEFI